jgi:hypothetical protein
MISRAFHAQEINTVMKPTQLNADAMMDRNTMLLLRNVSVRTKTISNLNSILNSNA